MPKVHASERLRAEVARTVEELGREAAAAAFNKKNAAPRKPRQQTPEANLPVVDKSIKLGSRGAPFYFPGDDPTKRPVYLKGNARTAYLSGQLVAGQKPPPPPSAGTK
jgi:hypothetical protein